MHRDDTQLMDERALKVAQQAIGVFRDHITLTGSQKTLQLHVTPVHELKKKGLNACLAILDQNLRDHYLRVNGLNWKDEKRQEMTESGLVYVSYQDVDSGNIAAFLSFMITEDELEEDAQVLYLYEIHVSRHYQSLRIGSELINNFHNLARLLAASNDERLYNEATCLTVFSDNERALQWYCGLGYKLTKDSPRDKILRNKKRVKPLYYLMMRYNNQ